MRRRGPGGPRRGPGPRRGRAARPAARRHMKRNVRQQRRRRRRRRVLVGGAIVVGTGALAYKLGKNQTQQIEQQYGRSVEEMSDEELEQAVEELNLRKEPLDDLFLLRYSTLWYEREWVKGLNTRLAFRVTVRRSRERLQERQPTPAADAPED